MESFTNRTSTRTDMKTIELPDENMDTAQRWVDELDSYGIQAMGVMVGNEAYDEFLETMDSYLAPCDPNDISWAPINYFGPDGNHEINGDGVFELVQAGEKIAGFNIEANRVAGGEIIFGGMVCVSLMNIILLFISHLNTIGPIIELST